MLTVRITSSEISNEVRWLPKDIRMTTNEISNKIRWLPEDVKTEQLPHGYWLAALHGIGLELIRRVIAILVQSKDRLSGNMYRTICADVELSEDGCKAILADVKLMRAVLCRSADKLLRLRLSWQYKINLEGYRSSYPHHFREMPLFYKTSHIKNVKNSRSLTQTMTRYRRCWPLLVTRLT